MARAAAYVLTAWAILPMAAQTAHATLLSALLVPGQSITVGDLTFSDFTYLGGGDMPTAGAINVVPSTSGDAGLLFQGAFVNMAGGVGFDAIFGYRVTALSGMTITGAELAGNPSNTGLGSVALTEVFTPQIGTLGIFSRSPGATILTDSLAFGAPATSLTVQNALQAGANSGASMLSFFTPTFHVVPTPEPASITLLGAGLAALAALGIKRRKSVLGGDFRSQNRSLSHVSAVRNRPGDGRPEKNSRFFGIFQHLSRVAVIIVR